MKRLSFLATLLGAALIAASCAHSPQAGWVTLIDGEKGLENFDRIGDANWRAEGGAIVADKGKGGHLVTKKAYRDFELYAEFWADHNTNSGIFIRASDPKKVGADSAYEANIYDMRPEPKYGTGAIVDYAQVSPMPKSGGRWNTYEIYAKGTEITLKLNGQVTVSIHNDKYASGPFSLQFGNHGKEPGGAIKWRKVLVREL